MCFNNCSLQKCERFYENHEINKRYKTTDLFTYNVTCEESGESIIQRRIFDRQFYTQLFPSPRKYVQLEKTVVLQGSEIFLNENWKQFMFASQK